MPPTRILLVGAGAIGAFFGSRLATAPQVLVSALCRSNYKTVKREGFKIKSPQYGDSVFQPEFTFSSPEDARGLKWDYLLVATKVLPEVSDDSVLLEGLVGEDTSIVLVQNGLGIEEAYRRRFPGVTVLSAVTVASAVQPRAGIVEHNRWTRISVGPYLPHLDTGSSGGAAGDDVATERNERFVDLLRAGGIADAEAFSHPNLQFVRWHKVAINIAMNPTSVLSGGCGNQALALDPELAEHTKGVMDEVLSTAPKILGQEFPWQELRLPTPEQVLASVRKNTTGSRPSMWYDWVEGRRMEVEAILGNPLRIARERGVEMARVQSLYALLRMAQERRKGEDGKRSRL